ncbi:hypothetical protein RJT34_13749 [Clitoria ternatea]|uniref:Uncharacterized protein n=1 Tax=Clitoria ternatea TaxID=43366 RepID=A0AAN9PMJ7_CLITE
MRQRMQCHVAQKIHPLWGLWIPDETHDMTKNLTLSKLSAPFPDSFQLQAMAVVSHALGGRQLGYIDGGPSGESLSLDHIG